MNLRDSIAEKSTEKDRIRQKHLNLAQCEESDIRSRVQKRHAQTDHITSKFPVIGCIAIPIAAFLLVYVSVFFSNLVFVGGSILLIIIYFSLNKDKKEDAQSAEQRILESWARHECQADTEIAEYDREVKAYFERVIHNESGIEDMCKHMIKMFERMIGNASSASNQRFIDATLHFAVHMDKIQFFYDSQYTNRMSDYNFDVQRFRNLTSAAQCEGLAQALTKITARRMKMAYPPNAMKLDISHNDADVKMRFRGPNKNYIPPRPIA